MGTVSGIAGVLDVAVVSGGESGAQTYYQTPDGRSVAEVSNAVILFSDDFGGSAVNTAGHWDVLDGGLGANQALPSSGKSLTQGAIGSGTNMGNGTDGAANIALSVSASALTITMGTTNGAELWLLSQQAFAGTEDLFFTFQKSQALAANSIQVGLVEVDPTTLVPILNPNLANAFTNAGLAELGGSATATAYSCVAIADSSSAYATGSTGTALAAMTANSEFLVEFHAEDVIVSNGAVDSASAKTSNPSRVSSQVPNDGKVYKLLIRLRNTATPGSSTTVTFGRIMLWNSQELRVEVASGRGDANAQKAVAVSPVGTYSSAPTLTLGQSAPLSLSQNGYLQVAVSTSTQLSSKSVVGTSGGATSARIASGYDGVIKSGGGQIYGYELYNTTASMRWFHILGSASAVAAGAGTPVFSVPVPPTTRVSLSTDVGVAISTGLAWGVSSDVAYTTQGSSGDVVGSVLYD
jgi:hypothetical protein